jgi:phosphoribosylanthranilate isomerase
MSKTKVKICGLKTPEAMTTALESGADFVGLVFHSASPRHVEIEVAAYLSSYVPASVSTVGLFVDPSDDNLRQTLENVRLDIIQLHGNETPARVAGIKAMFGRPVMKALPVSIRDDLKEADLYAASDWLLFDAWGTPDMPGGNGLAFDWTLLRDFQSPCPWMLAGGLTPENVGEAIERLSPPAVDVSSGVEAARGVKDVAKIRAFIEAVRAS